MAKNLYEMNVVELRAELDQRRRLKVNWDLLLDYLLKGIIWVIMNWNTVKKLVKDIIKRQDEVEKDFG